MSSKGRERDLLRPGRPSRIAARALDERILDVAFEMFLAKGFDQTTIKGIAEACGTTRASVMRRYPTKCAIFLAAATRSVAGIANRIWGEVEYDDPLEELRETCRSLVRFALEPDTVAFFRAIAANIDRVAGLSPLILTGDQTIRSHFERIILRAQAVGYFNRHSASALAAMALSVMLSNPLNRGVVGDTGLRDDHQANLYFSSMWAAFISMA